MYYSMTINSVYFRTKTKDGVISVRIEFSACVYNDTPVARMQLYTVYIESNQAIQSKD